MDLPLTSPWRGHPLAVSRASAQRANCVSALAPELGCRAPLSSGTLALSARGGHLLHSPGPLRAPASLGARKVAVFTTEPAFSTHGTPAPRSCASADSAEPFSEAAPGAPQNGTPRLPQAPPGAPRFPRYLEGRRSLARAARLRDQQSQQHAADIAAADRPQRIILVRHGESEGNVDETAYTRIPDSRIALTTKGWEQAKECGRMIRELVRSDGEEDWKVYFYVSPYKRTIQTLRGIGLAFDRDRIAGVREEPRIREQDFGNFQCREKMRVEKQVRLRYGRFFYRFPDGESAADVYDRVTGFRETLRADIDVGRFQRPDFTSRNMNLVLVSHGLTLRVFLMRWYKWTVRQFEGLYNFDNATMMVMERGEGGRYSLSIHHSDEELRRFGMTDEMIADQKWQVAARPGELNPEWVTSGPSFFDHFDEEDQIIGDYVCDGLADADGCISRGRIPEELIAMQGGLPT